MVTQCILNYSDKWECICEGFEDLGKKMLIRFVTSLVFLPYEGISQLKSNTFVVQKKLKVILSNLSNFLSGYQTYIRMNGLKYLVVSFSIADHVIKCTLCMNGLKFYGIFTFI